MTSLFRVKRTHLCTLGKMVPCQGSVLRGAVGHEERGVADVPQKLVDRLKNKENFNENCGLSEGLTQRTQLLQNLSEQNWITVGLKVSHSQIEMAKVPIGTLCST